MNKYVLGVVLYALPILIVWGIISMAQSSRAKSEQLRRAGIQQLFRDWERDEQEQRLQTLEADQRRLEFCLQMRSSNPNWIC